MRTKHSIVHFSAPFALRGIEEVQPPGDYAIDEDEEPIVGPSWLGWCRVGTFIHLPAISLRSRSEQLVAIDPMELEAALQLDRDQEQASSPADAEG